MNGNSIQQLKYDNKSHLQHVCVRKVWLPTEGLHFTLSSLVGRPNKQVVSTINSSITSHSSLVQNVL